MAFNIKKRVFKGDTGELLSTESSPKAAKSRVATLHRINKPKKKNKGKTAKKRELAEKRGKKR